MSDFVRVRLGNGTEKSVPRPVAERAGLKPLDKPARAVDGSVARSKRRVNVPKKSNTEAKPSESKEG